jgi:predicted Zn-dependent protease
MSAASVAIVLMPTELADKEFVGLYDRQNNRIELAAPYWRGADVVMRYELVLHELGHAVLNKGHSSDKKAIMHEFLPNVKVLDPARLKELCTPDISP